MSADQSWRVTQEIKRVSDGTVFDSTFCIHESNDVPGAGALSAQTVADDIGTWLNPLFLPLFTSALRLERTVVRQLGQSDPTSAERISTTLGTRVAGTGILPLGCCVWLSIHTASATRRGRGGFHLPWPGDAGLLNSPTGWVTSGAYWTAVQALRDALLAGRDVSPGGIDHHYSLRVWSKADGIARDATGIIIRPDVKYVRTRMTAP